MKLIINLSLITWANTLILINGKKTLPVVTNGELKGEWKYMLYITPWKHTAP
jgi:hypothetical protein